MAPQSNDDRPTWLAPGPLPVVEEASGDGPFRTHRQAGDISRRTWVAAVTTGILLIGTIGFFVLRENGTGVEDPPPAALPGLWKPPAIPEPEVSAPSSAPPARSTAPAPPDDSDNDYDDQPTSKPPAHRERPVTPTVSVTRAPVPAVVDVSAQGARDWVHWGLTDPTSVNRRRGGSGEIKDLGGIGTPLRYDNNPQSFTWTGGTPTAATGPSPTGLYVCQPGGSFVVSVTAGPATRTLRLYAGVWGAQGRLTATLAGRTVKADLENRHTNGTAVFVIRFRAPAGEVLRVSWVNAVQFVPSCGNVDIQAAALS